MGTFESSRIQAQALSGQGRFFEAAQILASYRSQSFAIQSLAKNIQHRAQQKLSLHALEILHAFFGQSKESQPALEHLAQHLRSGKDLEGAFHTLNNSEQLEIRKRVGEENLQKIFFIAKNIDPKNFWEETIHFGVGLKQERRLEASVGVLLLASQDSAPAELRQRAEAEYRAILGQGSTGLRTELLLSTLSSEAMSYQAIFPMVGASIVGETLASVVLGRLAGGGRAWYSRGLSARALAGSAAFLGEASTFGLTSHYLNFSRSSLDQDLERAALGLGALRLFGFLGNQAFFKVHGLNEANLPTRLGGLAKINQLALPQASVFGGLMFAHKLEETLGLRAQVDNATTITDTLSSMFTMGVGAHLGRSALGEKFVLWQKNLGLKAEIYSSYEESLLRKNSGKIQNLKPLLFPLMTCLAACSVSGDGFDSGTFGLIGLGLGVLGMARGKRKGVGEAPSQTRENKKKVNSSSPPDPNLDRLLENIHRLQGENPADPEIKESFAVVADQLSENGDPRGEMMALAIEREELGKQPGKMEQRRVIDKRYYEIQEQIQDEMSAEFKYRPGLDFTTAHGLRLSLSLSGDSLREDSLERILGSRYASFLSSLFLSEKKSKLILSDKLLERFQKLREVLYRNRDKSPNLKRMIDSSALVNLQNLDLENNILGDGVASWMAASKTLVNLRSLNLKGNGLGNEGLQRIAASQNFDKLRHLDLSDNYDAIEGNEGLASSPNFHQLESLKLSNNRVGNREVAALAKSNTLKNLRILHLDGTGIDDEGAQAIVTSPSLHKLEELDLSNTALQDDAFDAIAASETLGNLRSLGLRVDSVDDDEVRLLSASKTLVNLEKFILGSSKNAVSDLDISDEGATAIADSSNMTKLRELRIIHSKIGDAGFRAIAQSSTLTNLEVLDLRFNILNPMAAQAIAVSKNFLGLRELLLGGQVGGGNAVARILAASTSLKNLELLEISHSTVGNEGASALANSPNFPNLDSLDLGSNQIKSNGAIQLFTSKNLKLNRLNLRGNRIDIKQVDPSLHSMLLKSLGR